MLLLEKLGFVVKEGRNALQFAAYEKQDGAFQLPRVSIYLVNMTS